MKHKAKSHESLETLRPKEIGRLGNEAKFLNEKSDYLLVRRVFQFKFKDRTHNNFFKLISKPRNSSRLEQSYGVSI